MSYRSDKLNDILNNTELPWEEVMTFLNNTGIIDDRNKLRTFTKIVQIANSNGYTDGLEFAKESYMKVMNENEVL